MAAHQQQDPHTMSPSTLAGRMIHPSQLPYGNNPLNPGANQINRHNLTFNCGWVVLACLVKQALGDTTGRRYTTQDLVNMGIPHDDSMVVDMNSYFQTIRNYIGPSKTLQVRDFTAQGGQVLTRRLLQKEGVPSGHEAGVCMQNGDGTSHALLLLYNDNFIHYTCYQIDSMPFRRNDKYEQAKCNYIWWW